MNNVTRYPILVFVISCFVLWLSVKIGVFFRRRRPNLGEEISGDLGLIQAAALTLLGLIIGFSFSMAVGRYDQCKNYIESP